MRKASVNGTIACARGGPAHSATHALAMVSALSRSYMLQ